jgi:hypothetical protein
MAQTIAARKVKLHDLKTKFGLQQVYDDAFFAEWQHDLPELTASESDRWIVSSRTISICWNILSWKASSKWWCFLPARFGWIL